MPRPNRDVTMSTGRKIAVATGFILLFVTLMIPVIAVL